MDRLETFAELHLDVLKEIGNIGAGHAATALSQLMDKQVGMRVPRVRLLPFAEICDSVGGPEQVVVAVFLRVAGEVAGNLFFILSGASAKRLLKKMVGLEAERGDEYSAMELSALAEIGNILSGSYLTSLADFTRLRMAPTVPSLAIDMAGAILGHGLLQYAQAGDQALLIDTMFVEGQDEVESHFFLLPDPESFAPMFDALGVKGR